MPCSGPVTARQRLVRLGVLASWLVLLTVWSDQQSLPIDQPEIKLALFNMQHRLAHLFAYGALGIMAAWAFEGWRRPALMAIILASIFGATDEWHQAFVPGRRSGLDDWAFDTFSAALALYLWPRFQRWRPRWAALAPVLIGIVFVLAVALLVRPHLSRPADLSRASLSSVSREVLSGARNVARQIRAVASG
jgi:VanZ family protein